MYTMLYYRLQLTGGGSETYTSCVGYSVFMLMLSSEAVPAAATAASCCLSMAVVSPESTNCCRGLRVYNIPTTTISTYQILRRAGTTIRHGPEDDVVMQLIYWVY